MQQYILFCLVPLVTVVCCLPGLTSDKQNQRSSLKLRGESSPTVKSHSNVFKQKPVKLSPNQRLLIKKFGEPKVSLEKANSRFQECCENAELLGDCLEICRYDIDKGKIFDAFFKKNCNAVNMFAYIQCASGGEKSRDVTECCQKSQIFQGKFGPNCRPFCRQDPPAFQIHRNVTVCGTRFNKIMDCYWMGMQP